MDKLKENNQNKAKSTVDDRAAKNVARLFSGEMSESEVVEISHWREEDVGYQRSFLEMSDLMTSLEGLVEDKEVMALLNKDINEPNQSWLNKIRAKTSIQLSLAASIIILCFSFYFASGWLDNSEQAPKALRYVTLVGEQKVLNLSDGSILTLNTDTEVYVDISQKRRHVKLLKGEAFFDIAKDPNKPFSVDIGSHSLQVLGTKFNVIKTKEDFSLMVVEGLVALHPTKDELLSNVPTFDLVEDKKLQSNASQQYKVKAGDKVILNTANNRLIASQIKDLENVVSWKEGFKRFDDVSLEIIVKELNRYSNKKIIIKDQSIKQFKVYAVLSLHKTKETLSLLQKTLSIKVIETPSQIQIVKK